MNVPLAKLRPATLEMGYRFRLNLDLWDSIERLGVIEPLLVLELPDGDYQIIDGTGRYEIAIALAIEELPIRIAKLGENPNGLILG